jgi:hypothetical protein
MEPSHLPPVGSTVRREHGHRISLAQLALTGIDLIAWAQAPLLDGELPAAEPTKLHYRLLHVAAHRTRTARRTRLRIAEGGPWADDLVRAFTGSRNCYNL